MQIKGSGWREVLPKRWEQPKGEDRTVMQEYARRLRCTLLKGLTWSTEKKYMRRCKGTFEIFSGIEHRLRKEEMEEQFNMGKWVFSVYSWHSEFCTPRNEALFEAVVKQVKATRHPWLIACDANMCPEFSEKCLWFQSGQMFVAAPKDASTCRSKGSKGEWIEGTYDYVVACHSLRGKSSQMEVVENFELRPHKAVSFVVERDK